MFKKVISMSLSIAALMCLAACGPKEEPAASIPPAEITDQTEEFSKPLVPLEGREGEDVESPYYRVVTADGQVCYEVQVAGEEEPTQIPIESVIYIVGSANECKLEKVNFSYTPEGGETEVIEQYRIYATSNTASLTGGEEPAEEETPAEGDTSEVDPAAEDGSASVEETTPAKESGAQESEQGDASSADSTSVETQTESET